MSHGRFFGRRRVPRLPTVMRSTTKISAMSAGYARYAIYARRALVRHGGQTGGPVVRVEPRISGDDAEPLRGSFPTDLDGIASRLDAAARLTIASHGASSDAKTSPTTAPTRTSHGRSAGT